MLQRPRVDKSALRAMGSRPVIPVDGITLLFVMKSIYKYLQTHIEVLKWKIEI